MRANWMAGRRRVAPRRTLAPSVTPLEDRSLLSVTILLDYSLDSSNFFNTQLKRDLLRQAATIISGAMTDSLAAIVPSGGNTWQANLFNPSTGTTQAFNNPVVPANTIILYAGGRNLAGTGEAGRGATSGFTASGTQAWLNLLQSRGKPGALTNPPTTFVEWGGSVAFDNSGSTQWFFGNTTAGLTAGQTDFLTVAQHEIAHALGFGTSQVFTNLVAGGKFVGPASQSMAGGQPVALSPGGDHWAQGATSAGSPAVMQPVLPQGRRLVFTPLDFAGLRDIGWQVVIPTTRGTKVPSNFLGTGKTDQAVYRSTTAQWFVRNATGLKLLINPGNPNSVFGAANYGDIPVPGDYDGIGRTELAVYRPSTGQWFVLSPSGVHQIVNPNRPDGSFGAPGDVPVPGDYDGIGRTQPAVFRPSTAQWIVLGPNGPHAIAVPGSSTGVFGAINLYDIPVPGDYDGIGRTQPAVFRPSTAQWFVLGPTGTHQVRNPADGTGAFGARGLSDIPTPGDYLGLGRTQVAVFRPSTGAYYVLGPSGSTRLTITGAANLIDLPTQAPAGALLLLDKIGPVRTNAATPGVAAFVAAPPSNADASVLVASPPEASTAALRAIPIAAQRPVVTQPVVANSAAYDPPSLVLDDLFPGSLLIPEERDAG